MSLSPAHSNYTQWRSAPVVRDLAHHLAQGLVRGLVRKRSQLQLLMETHNSNGHRVLSLLCFRGLVVNWIQPALAAANITLRGVPYAQIVCLGLGSGSLLKPDLAFDGPWGKLAVFPGTKQTKSSPEIEQLSLPGRPVVAIPSPERSLSRPNSGENARSKLNSPTKFHGGVETSHSCEDIDNCVV
jgi:hypothetical protein